jgi:hypothetical protein
MALTPGSPAPPDPPRARRPYLHIYRSAPTTPRTCPGLAGSPVSAGDTLTSYTTPRARRLYLPPPRARQLFTLSSPAWAAPGSHLNSHLPRAHRLHLHPPGPSSSIRNLPSSLASPTPLWARRFICTRAHRFICHKPTVKATMHNQVNISRDLPHLPHLPRASWYSPRDLSEPWRWVGIPRPVTACFFRVLTDCENQWGSSKLPQAVFGLKPLIARHVLDRRASHLWGPCSYVLELGSPPAFTVWG